MSSENNTGFIKGVFATFAAVASLIAIYEFVIRPKQQEAPITIPPATQVVREVTKIVEVMEILQTVEPAPTVESVIAQNPTEESSFPPFSRQVEIRGNNRNGTKITTPATGIYRIYYVDGSYSTGSQNAGGKQFRTAVYIYKNTSIQWGNKNVYFEPIDPSHQVGCKADAQPTTLADEQNCARATLIKVELSEGGELTFLAVDDKGAYGDNNGSLLIAIERAK